MVVSLRGRPDVAMSLINRHTSFSVTVSKMSHHHIACVDTRNSCATTDGFNSINHT